MSLKLLHNLSIGTRLGLGFGTVVLLAVLLAALASIGVGVSNTAVHTMVDDRYPKIRAVAALIDDVNVISLTARNLVLPSDAETHRMESSTLKQIRIAVIDDWRRCS